MPVDLKAGRHGLGAIVGPIDELMTATAVAHPFGPRTVIPLVITGAARSARKAATQPISTASSTSIRMTCSRLS
jgi:hypothetical protein